jgi:hypothetical protein
MAVLQRAAWHWGESCEEDWGESCEEGGRQTGAAAAAPLRMSAARFHPSRNDPPKTAEKREKLIVTQCSQAKKAQSTRRGQFHFRRKYRIPVQFPTAAPSSVFDDVSACSRSDNNNKGKRKNFRKREVCGSGLVSHPIPQRAAVGAACGTTQLLFNTSLPPRCLDRGPRSLVARVLAYLGWQLSTHATAQVCRAGLVPPDTPGKCCGGTVREAVPLWEVRTSEAQRSDDAACTLHRG